MADETRTIIIDVEVPDKDFEKEIGKVNTALRKNKAEIKELSKDYGNNATAISKLEAKNRDLTKSKQQLIKESKTEANSLNALRLKVANLTKERNNLDTSTKEGATRFKELNKEILNNTNKLKEGEEAGGDFRRSIGNYSTALDKAIPGLGGVVTGIQTMTKAAIAFIATPLGLILAAIAIAVTAVKAAFTDSEAGQNKFNKIMGQINVVLGNFRDLLADLGEFIIEAFENPQESILAFGKLIRDNIVTRFQGLLNLIPNLAKAVKLLFEGEFAAAGKVAVDAIGQVTLGVESVTDSFVAATKAVTEFVTQTAKEIEIAKRVAEARADADILDRQLRIDRAKFEGEIARLRLRARKEDTVSAEERKQALLDAQVLQDKLLAQEKEVLELREFAQIEENKFARSAKVNLDAEAEAIAAVLRVEAERLNQQRQVQRELNRINGEIERDNARIAKERQKQFDDNIKRIQDQAKFEADATIKQNKLEFQQAKQLAQLKQQLGEQSLRDLQSIFKRGSKIADAAALAGIAADTAKAISGLVAASEGNPLNAITFGGAGIIQFVAGLARIGANIAAARKLIKGGGGGEIEQLTVAPTGGTSFGGLANVNGSLLSQFSIPAQNQADQNAALFAGLQNLPGGVVAVVEINAAQEKRAVKVGEAKLG